MSEKALLTEEGYAAFLERVELYKRAGNVVAYFDFDPSPPKEWANDLMNMLKADGYDSELHVETTYTANGAENQIWGITVFLANTQKWTYKKICGTPATDEEIQTHLNKTSGHAQDDRQQICQGCRNRDELHTFEHGCTLYRVKPNRVYGGTK